MYTKLNTSDELMDKLKERGIKKVSSIRIHEADKSLILQKFESVQQFIDECIEANFHENSEISTQVPTREI